MLCPPSLHFSFIYGCNVLHSCQIPYPSCCRLRSLLSNYFHDDALGALAIKFNVEDALPGTGVDLTPGDGDDNLVVEQQVFQVGIGVVFACLMMSIARIFGRYLFDPLHDVVEEAALFVVDYDRRGDMHGGDEGEAVLYATLVNGFLNIAGDGYDFFAFFCVEGEISGVGFQLSRSPSINID